ncbi:MAG: hypothetical protein IJY12_00200 [Clostridia bacterium]|nr:hypothetical protein [Clostridia bacterium]
MINFFFIRKRRMLTQKLIQAFPKEYRDDVILVCKRLSLSAMSYSGKIYTEEAAGWRLSSGEKVKVPYRIYLKDGDARFDRSLTPRQAMIYHCIFSRCDNGYVREKHIHALLAAEPPEWVIPYVIQLCSEYVAEILQAVYDFLHVRDCKEYRIFCKRNFGSFKLGHCRMISYWNEFYRYGCDTRTMLEKSCTPNASATVKPVRNRLISDKRSTYYEKDRY